MIHFTWSIFTYHRKEGGLVVVVAREKFHFNSVLLAP